jgi:hypothetical protein
MIGAPCLVMVMPFLASVPRDYDETYLHDEDEKKAIV